MSIEHLTGSSYESVGQSPERTEQISGRPNIIANPGFGGQLFPGIVVRLQRGPHDGLGAGRERPMGAPAERVRHTVPDEGRASRLRHRNRLSRTVGSPGKAYQSGDKEPGAMDLAAVRGAAAGVPAVGEHWFTAAPVVLGLAEGVLSGLPEDGGRRLMRETRSPGSIREMEVAAAQEAELWVPASRVHAAGERQAHGEMSDRQMHEQAYPEVRPTVRIRLSDEEIKLLTGVLPDPASWKSGQEAGTVRSHERRVVYHLQQVSAIDSPGLRLVLNAWTGKPEGIAVWNPKSWCYEISKPAGPAGMAARESVAGVIADVIVGEISKLLSSNLAESSDSFALISDIIRNIIEPKNLLFTLINHATRAAAIHAGLGPLAPLAGRFAEELCRGLFPPDQHKILDNLICVTDIAVCARAGKLQASDELRAKMTSEIASRIGKLLGPEQAGGDSNASEAARPCTRTVGRLATAPDLTPSPRIEPCGTCGGLPESSELLHPR